MRYSLEPIFKIYSFSWVKFVTIHYFIIFLALKYDNVSITIAFSSYKGLDIYIISYQKNQIMILLLDNHIVPFILRNYLILTD